MILSPNKIFWSTIKKRLPLIAIAFLLYKEDFYRFLILSPLLTPGVVLLDSSEEAGAPFGAGVLVLLLSVPCISGVVSVIGLGCSDWKVVVSVSCTAPAHQNDHCTSRYKTHLFPVGSLWLLIQLTCQCLLCNRHTTGYGKAIQLFLKGNGLSLGQTGNTRTALKIILCGNKSFYMTSGFCR